MMKMTPIFLFEESAPSITGTGGEGDRNGGLRRGSGTSSPLLNPSDKLSAMHLSGNENTDRASTNVSFSSRDPSKVLTKTKLLSNSVSLDEHDNPSADLSQVDNKPTWNKGDIGYKHSPLGRTNAT